MLSADVPVLEPIALFVGVSKDALRLRREGKFDGSRNFFP
jgi:hypothetical protein